MTRKTVKNPRVFRVRHLGEPWGAADHPYYGVEITTDAYRSLPDWVQSQIRHSYLSSNDDDAHCQIVMKARDELEALMRFKKLWAALPKRDE